MKKAISFMLSLLLILASTPVWAEYILVDKTETVHPDFSFDEDAELLEIYFPQIHGCDAALVCFGEYSMLIDCAGKQYREVQNLLNDIGITKLTYALNSHPDEDHIGGFDRVLKTIPAEEFLLGFPEDYDSGDEERFGVYAGLHDLNIPFRRVSHGENIDFGGVKMTVLQRTDDHLPRVNNKSVMLMIEYGERRFFFTGDIQRATQLLLAAECEPNELKADIMKFPHHGYGNMQDEFLDMVAPELVICTGGKIDTEGIKHLKSRKIPFMLTSRGVIRLTTDGTTWVAERL